MTQGLQSHSDRPLRIALIAGEASGDVLGASLIQAIKARRPDTEFFGIGGPKMISAGLISAYEQEKLAVRGAIEVLKHLPEILKIRRGIIAQLDAWQPDVLIGIDAPDFNLGVELELRKAGIPTLHLVSPSIWAWRAGRIKKIAQAVDRMLCIFPFETEIYDRAGIASTYVGHPLASEIPLEPDIPHAREKITQALHWNRNSEDGLEGLVIAVLPGSRSSEIELIAPVFFETMQLLAKKLQGQKLHFLIPVATPRLRAPLETLLKVTQNQYPEIQIHLLDGMSDEVLEASDVVLIASGTATLQAALWKKPMVISYKVPWLTAQIMKRQGYLPYVGLPNILCGEFVVPELLQSDATPEKLSAAILDWLNHPSKIAQLKERFTKMHETLRRPTGLLVAQAVAQTIMDRRRGRITS